MKCQKEREDTAFQVFFFFLPSSCFITLLVTLGEEGATEVGLLSQGEPGRSWRVNWPVPGMRKVGAGRMGKLLEILTRTSKSQFKS